MSPHPPQPPSVEDDRGILTTWTNAADEREDVDAAHVARLRAVIGEPPAELDDRGPIVTRPGRDPGLGPLVVTCEDGGTRQVDGALPADFPLGYHWCETADGRRRRLIVSPGRCWLPEGWRAWGWTVQLYAARSSQSWGMGDLRDLRTIREWSQRQGAGFLLVNPLHAVAPGFPQESSPYLPTTRRFRNPIYLCVEEVPGYDAAAHEGLDAAIADLQATELIERDRVWELKRRVLRTTYDATNGDPSRADFDTWRADAGDALRDYATWLVIAGEHGADWRRWPADLHDPAGSTVAAYADAHADDVGFEAWLQWLLERQLLAATGDQTVLQDLPIGVDGGGADAWAWQGVLAEGASVGAPPDLYSSFGQDWGSPPFVPWRLRAHDYEPFVHSIRATIAAAGGLRIDHIMGLFRLWWVPAGGPPAEGAYVRYPSADLLDIVALESHRHQALVVGEDLGTVEEGVREQLAERAILSYRLLYFEPGEPSQWPVSAMAAITTHDLPTVAGLWTGADERDSAEFTSEEPEVLARHRVELLAPLDATPEATADMSVEDAVVAAHRKLADAPSVLLSATLEDAVLAERRPNLPGTTERPNWSLPLPVLVDDLPQVATAERIAATLAAAVGSDAAGSDAAGSDAAEPDAMEPTAAEEEGGGVSR